MLSHNNNQGVTVGGHTWGIGKQALLYLFSPQQLPEMHIRPNHYSFDHEFVAEVDNIVHNNVVRETQSLGGNAIDPGIVTSPAINRAIKPAVHGIPFQTGHFEQMWTFLLIIDNAPMAGRRVGYNASNRIMYIGFIMGDEPCIEQWGKLTLNERAILMPTHKTHLNVKEHAGPAGHNRIIVPQMDEDIVSPSIVQSTTPERQYLLNPHSLLTSAGRDGYGMDIDAPGLAHIGSMRQNIRFDTDTKNPKKQLRNLISGLTRMKTFDQGDQELRVDFRMNPTNIRDHHTQRDILIQSLQTGIPDTLVGIQVNQAISMQQLIHEYPSVRDHVEVVKLPFNVPADYIYTGSPTPTNIWTSLLQSTLPSIFAYYGVSDIAFRFCSYNPQSVTVLMNEPIWEVQSIATFVPMDQENIKIRWQYILEAMQNQVFSIVHSNCGDFDVTVNFTANNYCAIQLQLMELEERPNDGYVVAHGAVMPLATPLIGREFDRTQNATHLNDLVEYTCNSSAVGGQYIY